MNNAPSLPPSVQVFERGWLSSNNVLLVDAERATLVDTGYATHAAQTLALVRHALKGRALDEIINTHLHSDHCGGNALLQQAYSAHTRIPAVSAQAVLAWDEAALSFEQTGQQCERFGFSSTLSPGDALRMGAMDWDALAAPGHDPHSLILFNAEHGILISADALWENGFGVVFPELEGHSGFDEVAETLELIASLDVRTVIPGHGEVFTDVDGALERARDRFAYLRADPARNARNGIKVLLKFSLLERQSIAVVEASRWLNGLPLVQEANRRFLGFGAEELAPWAIAELVRVGAAAVVGDQLVNQ